MQMHSSKSLLCMSYRQCIDFALNIQRGERKRERDTESDYIVLAGISSQVCILEVA